MRQRTRQHGFTLVELITVIVILGVMSAVALPRLMDRSVFQARGFEEEVLAALRHARALAVASGCNVQVGIAGNAYVLNQPVGCSGAGGFTVAVVDPATQNASYTGTAPVGITLSAAPATFEFDRLGQSAVAGVPTNIVLTLGGNANRTITVFGSTGFAQVL